MSIGTRVYISAGDLQGKYGILRAIEGTNGCLARVYFAGDSEHTEGVWYVATAALIGV